MSGTVQQASSFPWERFSVVLRVRVRHLWTSVVASIAAVLVLLAQATHAYADPNPATIEAQIDQMWNTLEPLIEQYNGVHSQLKANQVKADALQKQIAPLLQQVDAAMAKVSDVAVALYKGGAFSMINAVLDTGSPTSFADRLALLDQMAAGQRNQISAVIDARDKYLADKKVLDDLIKQLQAQDADLLAKKKQIEAQIANLQKLRQQAYGTTGGTGALRPVPCPVEYIGGAAGKAAATACAQVGKPYVWAADGPSSFDCSGLTMYAWAAAGVSLPHYTQWQYQQTKRISAADLRVGDLVFFYGDRHHVAIYMGGGWTVHAPHPGDVVRMAKISNMGPVNGYGRPG
jgi:peptidoglycan DL-endopeptidase CwlO